MKFSEHMLRAILDVMPSKFFLKDRENRILLTNKAVADSIGVGVEELEGTSMSQWFPDEAGENFQNDLAVMQSGQEKLGILEPLAADSGTKQWISADKYPYRDRDGAVAGVIVFVQDDTEEANIAAALRQSEEQLRAANKEMHRILGTIPNYVWSAEYDLNNDICRSFHSPYVETITGRPASYFIEDNSRWLVIVHPDDRDRITHATMALRAGQIAEIVEEYRIVRPDGTVHWVHDSMVGTQLANGNTRLDGIITDITERKIAEHERARLEESVRQSQKLESLGVLAGGIAHDFNNILTAVLGNAGMAQMALPPDSTVRKYLDEVETATLRAGALCNQMLAYSGKGRFRITAIDLSETVKEITHMLSVSISKKATIKFELQDNLSTIMADPNQIQQVIMNLITNASDALGEGSGVITIATGEMECDRRYLSSTYLDEELEEGRYVYLEVSDSGCGMDTGTVDKIFDPFFSTKFTGRGLGLAALLGIVRGHKGAIRVTSILGAGSTFRLLFPASDEPKSTEIARNDDRIEQWRGSGTILVVDDEKAVRSSARACLESCGFDVLLAADGHEAVQLYRQSAQAIDAVLLDLTMPRMGGEEAFHELRRIHPDARIILSSGYNEQAAIAHFSGKGLAGFLKKPYTARDLAVKMRELLEPNAAST